MGGEKEREGGDYIIFYLSIYYVYRKAYVWTTMLLIVWNLSLHQYFITNTRALFAERKGGVWLVTFLEKTRSEELVIKHVS